MIVRIERGQNAFWVDVLDKEIGVFEEVYIDGEKVNDDDWQTVYIEAASVYISGDAVFIYTLAGEMHNVIRALAEVLKHG